LGGKQQTPLVVTMIAAVAYFVYREHQKKQQQEDEQRRDQFPDSPSGQEYIDTAAAESSSSSLPLSSWFASLPLEESTLNCYFSDSDSKLRSPQQHTSVDMSNGRITTTTTGNGNVRNIPNHPATVTSSPVMTTTFQESVRKEWIQAVFGTEFPSKGKDDMEVSPQSVNANNYSCIKTAWKGVGLSRIPYYSTYTLELQPTDTRINRNQQQEQQQQQQQQHAAINPNSSHIDEKKDATTLLSQQPDQKLGITLSRLTLGLYVRHVYPGSEAWCAGVQKNSILVSINHGTVNLLAEPTKAALERIWQYEGFGASLEGTGNLNTTITTTATTTTTTRTPRNSVNGNHDESMPSNMVVHDPICMTFILHGREYDVVFLSSPPYGIDWAPCGNFCLVKKVTSERAKHSGILPSSIVAGIAVEGSTEFDNPTRSGSYTSLYQLDHQTGAVALQQAALSNQAIRIQLCFPPTSARSGHWERQQDATLQENDRANSQSNNGRSTSSDLQRPKVAWDMDGVQVRIHPLLAGGSLRRNNSHSKQVMTKSLVGLSKFAARVAAGEPWSPFLAADCNFTSSSTTTTTSTTTLRKRSNRIFHTENQQTENFTSLVSMKCHFYRPCPPLEKSLLQCWSAQQAISYLCWYHMAEYDEQKLLFSANEDFVLPDLLQSPIKSQASDVVESFLLFWVVFLTSNNNRPLNLARCLLQLSMHDTASLAHPMEFLAGAFGNDELKKLLGKLRNHRLRLNQQQQRQLLHQQPSKPVSTSGKTTKRQGQVEPTMTQNIEEPCRSIPPSTLTDCVNDQDEHESEVTSSKRKNKNRFVRLFRKIKRIGMKQKHVVRKKSPMAMEVQSNVDQKRVKVLEEVEQPEEYPRNAPSSASSVEPASSVEQEDIRDNTSKEDSLVVQPSLQDSIFLNAVVFLEELNFVCEDIEKSLLQSFSQKFARWALQPWTPSKETALAKVTHGMRERLNICNQNQALLPLINPVDTAESFLEIDAGECFVLPSAHFPLLLTFNCQPRTNNEQNGQNKILKPQRIVSTGRNLLYRTIVELVELRGSQSKQQLMNRRAFWVHGSVAGSVLKSERSVGINPDSNRHVWDTGNTLVFDSLSSWGPPKTLSLRLTQANLDANGDEQIMPSKQSDGSLSYLKECGFCWIDLELLWQRISASNSYVTTVVTQAIPSNSYNEFDEHGDRVELGSNLFSGDHEKIEIELRVTTKIVECKTERRSLLFKHDDDVRQELFAIEFIRSCDRILRSCGLDMKMLTFAALPVGNRQGFIEWIYGSVPLSEICQPFAGSILARKKVGSGGRDVTTYDKGYDSDDNTMSSVAKAGMTKYESLYRVQQEGLTQRLTESSTPNNNPIQDYLRSHAYDPNKAYKIKKEVMDAYVKSCAGYSVCTYLLGVGDRHLDNLLLHQSGHFFHCDYSFILGNDPKKYLPMRITRDMVDGMGGPTSDNFCQFLSLACAAFLTFRRPENVRHLLSLVRVMEGSGLPDLEGTQTLEDAIRGLRNRLRLDLDDEGAINFMETLIEDSYSSKMWMAVDAIHSLAQRF
jgi:hypothetical protein